MGRPCAIIVTRRALQQRRAVAQRRSLSRRELLRARDEPSPPNERALRTVPASRTPAMHARSDTERFLRAFAASARVQRRRRRTRRPRQRFLAKDAPPTAT